MSDEAKDASGGMDYFHVASSSAGRIPEDFGETMRAMHGPLGVDQAVRQAVNICWMTLPKERRTAETIEKEIRRIVERVLRDFREDTAAFGVGSGS